MLYSFAFILDPRSKMRGFNKLLILLSQLNGNDYSCYFTEVNAELSVIFSKYDDKFGGVRLQRGAQPNPTGKKKLLGVRSIVMMLLILVLALVVLILVLVLVLLSLCIGDHLLVLCCKLQLLVLL